MHNEWPHPAYRIETPRLLIRCCRLDDAAELMRAVEASRAHLAAWMPWAVEPTDLEANVELMRRFRGRFDLAQDFVYGIYDPASGRQIGGCGLHPRVGPRALEIGYWIAADRVREGLATEAGAALTRVGFEIMAARRMEIRCDPANVASAGVPAKLGYARDGTLRWALPREDGTMRDASVFTMTADDYPATAAAAQEVRGFGSLGQRLLGE